MKVDQISCTRVQGDEAAKRLPLVMHVIYRFDTGGLENGVVNIINHMPPGKYDHLVLALTEVTDFRGRLQRDDVECLALRKPPGHGVHLSLGPIFKLHVRIHHADQGGREIVQASLCAAGDVEDLICRG